jgi:hypothetical protein|tara:strand:- start:75 stop:284 length:210 start_codon:yes stop_codon:yes gene_type:complete
MSDQIVQLFNQMKTQIKNKLAKNENQNKRKPPPKLQRQNAMSFTNIYTANNNPMNTKHPKQTNKIAYIM